MNAFLSGAQAMLVRDARIFVSYRIRFVTVVLSTVFSLTLFYYLSRLITSRLFSSPDEYYSYAVVGLVILSVLNSTLGSPPGQLRQELVAGTFERLFYTPLGPLASTVAALFFPFVNALIVAMLSLLYASAAFGMDLRWETLALAVPVGALGALAFLPFGVLLLAATMVVKQAAAGTTWVVALISLVSGLYFPVEVLPAGIEWASHVQPFTPAAEVMRSVIVGYPMEHPLEENLAKLIGFAAALLPASLVVLRLAIGKSRQTGTIIEY